MDWIQALILGFIQGLTEFLPVSSSAHLRLVKKFLSIPDGEHLLYFDLLCHLGTLFALVIYLRKDIWNVLSDLRKIALYSVAIAPLVPAYFLLKPIRVAASDPAYLGYFLLVTAALLFAASRRPPLQTALGSPHPAATELRSEAGLRQREIEASRQGSPKSASFLWKEDERSEWRRIYLESKFETEDRFIEAAASPISPKWRDVLFIGLMQAMALIPGISRSGSTIAAARFCGWDWMEAARFSFLLAVPTILGGELLETVKILGGQSVNQVPLSCYAVGFGASFVLGMFGVRLIFRIYKKGRVLPFAWYCAGVGLLAIMMFRNG